MNVEVPVDELTEYELNDYMPPDFCDSFCDSTYDPDQKGEWICTRKRGHSGTHVGGWSRGDAGIAWRTLSDEAARSEFINLAQEMREV